MGIVCLTRFALLLMQVSFSEGLNTRNPTQHPSRLFSYRQHHSGHRPVEVQHQSFSRKESATALFKKRKTRSDDEDPNQWYESVNADASPDEVFWQEMDRSRSISGTPEVSMTGNIMDELQNQAYQQQQRPRASSTNGSTMNGYMTGTMAGRSLSETNAAFGTSTANGMDLDGVGGRGLDEPVEEKPPMSMKSVESTLAEYEIYAVKDNWLDEELREVMTSDDDKYMDFNENAKSLEDQLDDWESISDDELDSEDDKTSFSADEPWDQWANANLDSDGASDDEGNSNKAKGVLFDLDAEDTPEDKRNEEEFQKRLAKLKIKSERLDRARDNPKAAAFFQRGPDVKEGYDHMWVSAIDNVCMRSLVGMFRNYGVQFADNFGDFEDGCVEDGFASIEDVASYKARKVHEVTGLPCIACRTSFQVEPVPDLDKPVPSAPSSNRNAPIRNPRVASGYRFNDIGMHVDYICEALRAASEPARMTRFETCFCFYDGEIELFQYGVCDVDLVFADSMRTFVPVAIAINEIVKTLQLTFGLEFQAWLNERSDEDSMIGKASIRLRDRVLKEGRVLPNSIVDVSSFMDSMVDVKLMDLCAQELAQRFASQKPSKILTVATTGLVLAIPLAKYLQVPVVYARKERNVVMSDTYKAGYSSKTVGKNRELLVSKSHVGVDDRILIVDDFLSSGAVQEALLRIVSESGATAVGVGVLLEKVYESGRQSLSGFDVPVESLCRIASVQGGAIQLVEEAGFEQLYY